MFKILIITSLLTSLVMAETKQDEEWKLSGRLNAYVQHIELDGNGSASLQGTTHVEELNVNYGGVLGDGQAGIETRLRNTDDERVQIDQTELLYMRAFYTDKQWTLEAGDVAASLNPYIYSGSAKGAKLVYKSAEKKRTFNYSLVSGLKNATWRDLYTEASGERPAGYSGAFEVKYIHERAKEISMSVAGHKDDLSTGDANLSVQGKEGYGFGLDGKWRFNKYLSLKGRGAVTNGTDNVRDDTDGVTKSAIWLRLLTRPILKSVKSNFVYQRVDKGFISFGGSANDDKEQLENSTTWTINKELRARMDLKGNRDNLDNSQVEDQTLHYEALLLTYRPSFVKRGDLTLRGTNKGSDGRGVDSITQTAGLNLNLRQKSGWRYGGGYDYSNVNDRNASTDTTTHVFKALLGYKQKLSKESSFRFTLKPSYLKIEGNQDKQGLHADAGYVYDRQLSMDLLYRVNQIDYDISNNTLNSTYQARAAYRLNKKTSDIIRVLVEKRDVEVDNDSAKTYSEYRGKLSLVLNF